MSDKVIISSASSISNSDFEAQDAACLAAKIAAYQICRERGHVSESTFTVSGLGPIKNVCRYCGTLYWQEVITHEKNVPDSRNARLSKPEIETEPSVPPQAE